MEPCRNLETCLYHRAERPQTQSGKTRVMEHGVKSSSLSKECRGNHVTLGLMHGTTGVRRQQEVSLTPGAPRPLPSRGMEALGNTRYTPVNKIWHPNQPPEAQPQTVSGRILPVRGNATIPGRKPADKGHGARDQVAVCKQMLPGQSRDSGPNASKSCHHRCAMSARGLADAWSTSATPLARNGSPGE